MCWNSWRIHYGSDEATERKRRKEVVPALGVVGVSLSLASGASAATAGSVTDMPSKDTATGPGFALSKEEISDVSLGTFYVFDKENAQALRGSVSKWPVAGAEVAAAAEAAEVAAAAPEARLRRRAGVAAGAAAACRGALAKPHLLDGFVMAGFDQVRPGHHASVAALPGAHLPSHAGRVGMVMLIRQVHISGQ